MTQIALGKPSLSSNIKYALKANVLPAIFLQTLAICIGLSYFYWSAAQPVFSFVAELRAEYGLGYAIVSTSIFGGLLPFCFMYLKGGIKTQVILQLLFYCVLWALMGVLIAEFYTFQAYLFGSGNDFFTVAKKVAFDQFVYSVLITCPFLTLVYMWKDNGFSWSKTKPLINRSLLTIKIPTVSVIYMLPTDLQIPLFNFVLCLFVLILALLHVEE